MFCRLVLLGGFICSRIKYCEINNKRSVASSSFGRGGSYVGCLMRPWGVFRQFIFVLGRGACCQILSCDPLALLNSQLLLLLEGQRKR